MKTVTIEVDDLNGNQIPVTLDVVSGNAIPVSQPATRTHFSLRVLAWDEGDGYHPAVEAIAQAAASISWTGTHRDLAGAADDAIERSRYRTSTPDRAELVRAAGFLVAAIAAIDAQAPVEVRRDDLRYLLTTEFDGSEEVQVERLRRLRDAAGLNGAIEEPPTSSESIEYDRVTGFKEGPR